MSDAITRPAGDLPEGEERPPPGTRAAAIFRWALVALMGAAAVGAWVYHATSGGVLTAEARFQCPMHPTIVQAQKGECPICGMDLVPVAPGAGQAKAGAAAEAPAPTRFQCPMHPSIVQDAKGDCPVCGMALVAAAAPSAPAAAGAAEYTCPMHPAFVTPDPKARCPECGMKLVPRSADAAPGVAGLAPVELSADRIQLIGMKTAAATREALPTTLRTAGFVTPAERGVVSVTARYTGWIEAVAVDETGRSVRKGEVLATVYSPEVISALQTVLAAAKWSGRTGAPVQPGSPVFSGDAQRDTRARAELLGIARQDIDAVVASGELPSTVPLRAPVSGHVARKSAVRGMYLTPGVELFQLADLGSVWVVADVYEAEIGRVRVGQKATLEVPAWPGEVFTGKVAFIFPALAAGSRTLQARIELRNPGLRLRPGMYGDVTLDLGAQAAVTIPADALIDTGEHQYVFVSKGNGRFEPRRVRRGWSGGGRVAVLSGLAEGERVVTTANFLVDSESRLRAAIEGFGSSGGTR